MIKNGPRKRKNTPLSTETESSLSSPPITMASGILNKRVGNKVNKDNSVLKLVEKKFKIVKTLKSVIPVEVTGKNDKITIINGKEAETEKQAETKRRRQLKKVLKMKKKKEAMLAISEGTVKTALVQAEPEIKTKVEHTTKTKGEFKHKTKGEFKPKIKGEFKNKVESKLKTKCENKAKAGQSGFKPENSTYEKVNRRIYTPKAIKRLTEEKIKSKIIQRELNLDDFNAVDPNKLTVVFDLNGILIFRKNKVVSLRPNIESLVDSCLKTFNVVIWSSATKDTISRGLELVFGPEKLKLSRVYTRDDTIPLGNPRFKVVTLKDLSVLWADLNFDFKEGFDFEANPMGPFNCTNTIIIDDSVEKCANQVRNLVCPKPYNSINKDDTELTKLSNYLKCVNNLCNTDKKDVRDVIREFSFAQFNENN